MNNLALSVALATAPSSAFVELRERPRFWFPLLVVLASTVAIIYWYYSAVDFEWLKDVMYGNNPDIQALPEDKRAAAMAMLSRNTLLWGSVVGAIIFLPIVFLLSSLYLWLAAKVTKLPLGFKHWFALTCWTMLPALLSSVVSAIFLIMSDSAQMTPSVLAPLSVNELVLHRPFGSPGYSLFQSLGITSVLTWILAIVGVHVWSQRSWAFSAAFMLLPTVVIYGVWAFFAFR
jgi:Yip1 domain